MNLEPNYLNVLLLTAKTIYIHIFYFLQAILLGDEININDSQLTRC